MKLEEFKYIINEYEIINFYEEDLYNFMEKQSHFSKVIRQFKDEDSTEGDFARDYISDKKKPQSALNILQHIVNLNASSKVIKSYLKLVERFKEYTMRNNE